MEFTKFRLNSLKNSLLFSSGLLTIWGGVMFYLTKNNELPREPFIFVRHGKTNWSFASINQGPSDLPLNIQGEVDAQKAASILEGLEDKNFVIISSQSNRALQTAEIIAKKTGKIVNGFPDLHERYFGDFRLITTEESKKGILPPDVELESSFQKRIYKTFVDVLKNKDFAGAQKIIVSHALVFKKIVSLLTGEHRSVDYGDVMLFTPNEVDKSWSIKKIQ